MKRNSMEPERKAQTLRHDAEDRLRKGSAPVARAPLDKDALSLLFDMASDPKRSSDALKLLHELQVHQVELDLQREERDSWERDISRELVTYRALFELTPDVCLVTTIEGWIVEANPAAENTLKTPHEDMVGRALQEFVARESQSHWLNLLQILDATGQAANFELVLNANSGDPVQLTFSGKRLAHGDVLLYGVIG